MAKPIKISVDKCIGCESCALVCSMFKSGSLRPKASGVVVYIDQFNKEEKPIICRHCKTPKCVPACPNSCLIQDEKGIVMVDEDNCNGCWACVEACPFQALNKDVIRKVIVKCDLCNGREDGPLCVSICPVQALTSSKEGV